MNNWAFHLIAVDRILETSAFCSRDADAMAVSKHWDLDFSHHCLTWSWLSDSSGVQDDSVTRNGSQELKFRNKYLLNCDSVLVHSSCRNKNTIDGEAYKQPKFIS